MSLGKNIHDAFEIVEETYENVYKLMNYCQEASEEGGFVLSSPKILRWKSDVEIDGWLMKSFILLFQHSKDRRLKNKWRKGPIFVIQIDLNPYREEHDGPMVNLAKFEYNDISTWNEGISLTGHKFFYEPLYNNDIVKFEGDVFSYCGSIVNEEYSNRYWGLRRIVGIGMPLTDITRENAFEKIFGEFQSLIDK